MSRSLYDTARPYRALWVQVVAQAKDDLEREPVSSIPYDDAVAFFAGNGPWAAARGFVADLLEMHPDDLFRSGQRWIAARRERDGLSPQPPQAPPKPEPVFAAPQGQARLSVRPGPLRRVAWTPAATALGASLGVAKVNREGQQPAAGRRKGYRRHWSTNPGATNPFAPPTRNA